MGYKSARNERFIILGQRQAERQTVKNKKAFYQENGILTYEQSLKTSLIESFPFTGGRTNSEFWKSMKIKHSFDITWDLPHCHEHRGSLDLREYGLPGSRVLVYENEVVLAGTL